MHQLTLLPKQAPLRPIQAKSSPLSTTLNLTRDRLAMLDYAMECPLSFVSSTTFCHNCVLFAGGQIDLTTHTPQVTLRCKAGECIGLEYSYRPGNIGANGTSTIAGLKRSI